MNHIMINCAFFRRENIQCQIIDTDAFVWSLNTENIIKVLKNLKNMFGFGNLD